MSDPVPVFNDLLTGTDRRKMLIATLVVGVVSGAIFVIWPAIDQQVADLFVGSDGGYLLKSDPRGKILRTGFTFLFGLGVVFAVISLLFTVVRRQNFFGHGGGGWFYLVLVLIIGPGLVANTLLKDNWGRARPIHVSQHGKIFTPALIPSDQCERNCSFVSGESASIYALFFGLALMGGRWWRRWLDSGLALGSLAGLMRMAQGGHYLSDVVFSAVFMAGVALAISYLLTKISGTHR